MFRFEEFKDTKEVIKIRILKNRQHNDQKRKYKRRNHDPQKMHIKLRSSNTNPTKHGGELRYSGTYWK